MKVFMKTQNLLNHNTRYDLMFKPQMVIDLDKIYKDEDE